ncbi:heme-dependent oxidative N-demethylase family protein [Parafilimonas sp.]|uniref:heme-dependent oxidative N-demethylase family protein n=1 Tax=Parafilimonas sp. TaxID=1969739 RepID=UPI0039E2D2AF
MDQDYDAYLGNKKNCRNENMHKYCCQHNLNPSTIKQVTAYIASQLQKEYPSLFEFEDSGGNCFFCNVRTHEAIAWNKNTMQLYNNNYISLFDALCSQAQEDFAICQLENNKDWLAAIHVCSPNHWSPQQKTGKPFDAVHAPVAGMQKTFGHYFKMLQSIVQKGPFTRFAWGIATDNRLNHHPEPPPSINKTAWEGRQINDAARLFIRTERQNMIGFPEVNAFLFTIRTYFYEADDLNDYEKKQLWLAVQSMPPESLAYKGLTNAKGCLAKKLSAG